MDQRIDRWGGSAAHDGTGLGDVVDDYLEHPAEAVILAGKARADMLTEYIAAIEHGEVEFPRIEWAHQEHREASFGDVYGAGHCPDSIMAGALAWRAYRQGRGGTADDVAVPEPAGVREDTSWA